MFQTTSDKWSEVTKVTSNRFRSIINNFQLFLQCNFHFYLNWSSSDMSVYSDWVIGPQAQPIQPKQYLKGN